MRARSLVSHCAPCTRGLSSGPAACQTTVRRETVFTGIGLHSGRQCLVAIRPAPADHGIRFECGGAKGIRAAWSNVVGTSLSTVLAGPPPTLLGRRGQEAGLVLARLGWAAAERWFVGPTVATVEHLMAALSAAGVDNASIHVAGGEVPILDGSARDFSAALSQPGAVLEIPRSSPAPFVFVRRHVAVDMSGGRRVSLSPWDARREAVCVCVSRPAHPPTPPLLSVLYAPLCLSVYVYCMPLFHPPPHPLALPHCHRHEQARLQRRDLQIRVEVERSMFDATRCECQGMLLGRILIHRAFAMNPCVGLEGTQVLRQMRAGLGHDAACLARLPALRRTRLGARASVPWSLLVRGA